MAPLEGLLHLYLDSRLHVWVVIIGWRLILLSTIKFLSSFADRCFWLSNFTVTFFHSMKSGVERCWRRACKALIILVPVMSGRTGALSACWVSKMK